MSYLAGKILVRVLDVIRKELPLEHSIHGLENLPPEILSDLELINHTCDSIHAFAYLKYVSDASFHEIKSYLDKKGWHSSAD